MNRIQSDEDTMARLLGVPVSQIPESVFAEYDLRLSMWHSGGASGPLGLHGIIDLLRFLKLGRKPPKRQPQMIDWSLVPMDGSVQVMAKPNGKGKWASGVYVGTVRGGRLAVRFDGDAWVHELSRLDVRIARDEPMQPISSEDAFKSDLPLEEQEPWISMADNETVLVTENNVYKDARFQRVEKGKIVVVVADELTARPIDPEQITCLESRWEEIAKKGSEQDAE